MEAGIYYNRGSYSVYRLRLFPRLFPMPTFRAENKAEIWTKIYTVVAD